MAAGKSKEQNRRVMERRLKQIAACCENENMRGLRHLAEMMARQVKRLSNQVATLKGER